MSVVVYVALNGVRVPIEFDDEALAAIAHAIGHTTPPEPQSPLMTVMEAAAYLRCSRQRIDDLLSQRRLTRIKDGRRTLVRRDEIHAHLASSERKARG